MSNYDADLRERAEQTVDHIDETHGLRYFTNTLLGRTDEGRFGAPLDDPTLGWLEHIMEDHPNDESLLREFLVDALLIDKGLWEVDRSIVSEALDAVGFAAEQGHDRCSQATNEAAALPPHLAQNLLQSEIDHAEGTCTKPQDYEELLILYQALTEYRGERETEGARKELWDELLKFTKYAARIRYENADGDTMTEVRTQWAQQNSTAHNEQLKRFRDARSGPIHFIDIGTTPEELYCPSLDPLSDIEGWVMRDWW